MNPNYAADAIISSVKKSNLNFYIQETPFSLFINLRKTFINNKSGDILQSDHCETIATVKTEVEQDSIRKLETEVNETRDALCKQSCKNMSLVPQAHFFVQMWFLKICRKF